MSERTRTTVPINSDLWTDWKDTVPRSVPLADRLAVLLQFDIVADLDADAELAEVADARRALIQIRRHTMRASQNVEDDPEAAREELRTILNVLDAEI